MRAVGYTRVAADAHDLDAELAGLAALGVRPDDVYVDYGLIGCADRPGLDQALAACRPGDALVVTKLHRLALSISDACEIARLLGSREVLLILDGHTHDPADPTSRLIFKTLSALADFESDLVRSRTREGLRAARAAGRLRGKPPKLGPEQQARLVELHHSDGRSPDELAELFGVARSTVYRILGRARRGALPTGSTRG